MKTIIIGLSGKIGSGKTTLAEFLKEELRKIDIPVQFINFADALKKITYELSGHYGFTQEDKQFYLEDWGMTVGTMLQKLGTDVMRNYFDNQVWVKAAFSKIKEGVNIIGDCRFKNEAIAIKQKEGILIRVNGDPGKIRENSTRDINHISEIELDNYDGFDFIFENNGSKEALAEFAKETVTKLYQQINER